jgi:glycosyltransferase involved in cell wall biosynthesis
MKTVLHLIETSGPGGAEKMLISMVEHLEESKYRSIICLLSDGWLNSMLHERRFETIIIPQTRSLDYAWLSRLLFILRNRRCHLMHAHEFAMNTYASMASVITGTPIVTTVHGKSYYPDKCHRRLAYRFVSKRSTMVAVSNDIRQFLVTNIGINDDNVMTIHNGIEFNLYHPDNFPSDNIRSDLNIARNQPVIVSVGNLYPVKGHFYLLKALKIIKKQFHNIILIIAGRGNLLGELQKQASELNIHQNVLFLGFREDIHAILHAADIFILPSISEGLPLAALEAMACEKPVVASNVGGIPEVVIDRQTGLLVPARNPDSIAQKVQLLLRNNNFASKLGKRGRIRAETEFSVTKMVGRYVSLYENALLNKRGVICHH